MQRKTAWRTALDQLLDRYEERKVTGDFLLRLNCGGLSSFIDYTPARHTINKEWLQLAQR